nr:reverse transcriptase domain-containing protein [Tanacetum cinerariifolium]
MSKYGITHRLATAYHPQTSEQVEVSNREEIEAYLKDEIILPEINHADCDPEGDICLIEKLLNDDPFQLPTMDLKQGEVVKGSDFILEEIEAYLKDESISLEINHADCDPEGDISLIKKLLNNDSFQLPPMDLKQREVVKEKSSIEEPPELELKD